MVRRRKTFSDTATSYAAVGSTQAADVLIFPPAGFRSWQAEFKIGSGQARWEAAADALMTWGVQKGAHLQIVDVQDSESAGYSGLEFTEFGVPVTPEGDVSDQYFGADGTAYLTAGTVVEITGAWSPFRLQTRHRVIYVNRDKRRVGFALGTLDEYPVIGEELFQVEWRRDDSVWTMCRSVTSVPKTRFSWVRTPLIRLRQKRLLEHYIRALSPNRQA